MNYPVSPDEFAGFGASFEATAKNELGNKVMQDAMDILDHPELHVPERRKKKTGKIVSRIYNLFDGKERAQYEKDVSKIFNAEPGTILLLDRPPKQIVPDGAASKYVAYLEWAEYKDIESGKQRTSK